MPLLKLRQLDDTSAGVTIPKDHLLLEGLLDSDGDLVEQPHISVKRVGDGEWKVERVDDLPSPRVAD